MNNPIKNLALVPTGLFLCALGMVFLNATNKISTEEVNGFLKNLKERLDSKRDQLPEDRLYLQFDKSLYKPGETIWFAAYLRNAHDMKASEQSQIVRVELIDPKGNVAREYRLVAEDGHAAGDFEIHESMPGGIYKVRAYSKWQENMEEAYRFEKDITVQKVVIPRLKMKLDFEREAFGPGDRMIASLELETNENKPLANQLFGFEIRIDGKRVSTKEMTADAEGKAMISHDLPAGLKTNDVLLNVFLVYQDFTESISRSVPVVLGNMKLSFFPEGGDLLADKENRLAFAAVDEFGRPADFSGEIVDVNGKRIQAIESYQFGMGSTILIPRHNQQLYAKILRPKGNKALYPLPTAAHAGFAMRVEKEGETELKVHVESTIDDKASIIASIRDQVVYMNAIQLKKGSNELLIPTADMPIGVAQITLFDSKQIARCERLAFVNKDKTLKVRVSTDKEQYLPREKVKMRVEVKDERGMPMPGIFSLAVVDDAQLVFEDDKDGRIMARMLLEPELKGDVFEAGFYFKKDEPKAETALDLLLMTSGWRRITWKELQKNEDFEASVQGEKAAIGGKVMNHMNGLPIKDAEVTHLASGKRMTTGRDGRFDFDFLNLSEGNELLVVAKDLDSTKFTLNDYGTEHQIWMGPMNVMFKGAGGLGRAERLFRNQPVLAAEAVNEAMDMEEVLEMDGDVMLAAAPPDEEPLPEPEPAMDKNVQQGMAIMADEMFVGKREPIMPPQPDAVQYYRAREFAAPDYSKQTADEKRSDFRTTVFWEPRLEVDRKGVAELEFHTTDAITSFKALLEGFGDDGSIASSEHKLFNQQLLSAQARIPDVLVQGDKLQMPVTIVNNSQGSTTASLFIDLPEELRLEGSSERKVKVPAREAKTIYLAVEVVKPADSASINIRVVGAEMEDEIEQLVKIVPRGFPASVSMSGRELKETLKFRIDNPVQHSVYGQLLAYPSTTSELLSSIEDILRQPHGCFEQTSSSNYPNVLVLDYLRTNEVDAPEVESKALALLDKGYNKLISFETAEKGYEWFGGAPAHEALTAYGILEFVDMKKVYPGVDDAMIDRTVNWLMSRRDGKGGFLRNPKALDSYGRADEDITNAYAVYALSEAGVTDIQAELNQSVKDAQSSKDPYVMALVVNALYNLKDNKRGQEMLKELLKMQVDDGSWTGTRHSITRSTGKSLSVETTSLVVLAILNSDYITSGPADMGAEFIVNSRSGYGGFGSTQATVMALKALTAFASFSKRIQKDGSMEVYVNKKHFKTIEFKAGDTEPLEFKGLEDWLLAGDNQVEVRFNGLKMALPYTLHVSWTTDKPENSDEAVAEIKSSFGKSSLQMGELLRMSAEIRNTTEEGQPMTLAVLGIPAGCSAQPWQLKELQEEGVFDFYEIIDNRLAIYYRDLAPGALRTIELDLKAEMPGEFRAPASTAYLYYTPEHRNWDAGPVVRIEAE